MRICSLPLPHASACFPSPFSAPRQSGADGSWSRSPPVRIVCRGSPISSAACPCSWGCFGSGPPGRQKSGRGRRVAGILKGKTFGECCRFLKPGDGGLRFAGSELGLGLRCWCRGSAGDNAEGSGEVAEAEAEVEGEEDDVVRGQGSLVLPTVSWIGGVAGLVQLSWLSFVVKMQRGRWQEHVRGFGRVLGFGIAVMVVSLFPHRLLAARAVAAPAATVERVSAEGDVEEAGRLTEEDRARLADEARRKASERQLKLISELQLDVKLKELDGLLTEENVVVEKRDEVLKRINDLRVAAGAEIRRYRGAVIRETEAAVSRLLAEQAALQKELDKAVAGYAALRKEVERVAGAEKVERGRAVKNAERRLEDLWKKKVELGARAYEEKMDGFRTADKDLPRVQERVNESLERFWETWNENVKAREAKKAEEAKEKELVDSLEAANKLLLEQTVLPVAVGVADVGGEDVPLDPEVKDLVQQIKMEEDKSEKLQGIMDKIAKNEAENRENIMEGLSQDEIDFVMNQKEDGVAEDELPSMSFGWKKYRDRIREEYDQFLQENPEVSEQIAAEKQERILTARDRVVAETYYNEKQKRWEISPSAVSYSVTKSLADKARIRQDRKVMYLTLKGDDREYYVDLQAFEAEYHMYGGFEKLYVRMVSAGVKVKVELMWIPLAEWDARELFQLPFKMIWWTLQDVWNSRLVSTVRPFYWKTLSEAFEEVMIRFGFPLINAVLPSKARVALRLELPEGAEAAEPTEIIAWQQEAQKKVDARYGEGTGSPQWWISLPLRAYAVGAPLYYLAKYAGPILLFPFKPKPLDPNEVEYKQNKQKKLLKDLDKQTKKEKKDPIRSVFDKMKRVKRPQVSLKDFAGIDAVKEEINEAVTFLRNPKLFKEMGARPPRGILIVGDSGTGKTTLALAIAAEARVPMVELQGAELEGGSWVGQGASNVRELFKTARELAPLIIFMDDFDHFAGVRGATADTRKQDHESLINQLLVELDGFETQEGVVLIATTSRPWAIDEALRRPGRMDRTINLPMPNRREREQILRKVAQDSMDAHLIPLVDWKTVAEKTAGLTPAQLKTVPQGLEGSAVSCKISDDEELFSWFGWLATFNSITPRWVKSTWIYKGLNERLLDWLDLRVTKEEIEAAVDVMDVASQANVGLELREPPYVWTREFKYPHAVWAAGRGLIALLLPNFDVVDQIWLDPTSWEGVGFTKLSKRLEGGYQETGIMTRSYYEKKLVLCFGSFISARLFIKPGDNNNLSRFEIQDAVEIATRMVLEHGWAPDDSPQIYMPDEALGTLPMGEGHEFELEAKIEKLFYAACDRATKMMLKNRKVLDALLEHLLQFDIATKKDLKKILEDNEAVFEEEPFTLVEYTRSETTALPTNGTSRSRLLSAGPVAGGRS